MLTTIFFLVRPLPRKHPHPSPRIFDTFDKAFPRRRCVPFSGHRTDSDWRCIVLRLTVPSPLPLVQYSSILTATFRKLLASTTTKVGEREAYRSSPGSARWALPAAIDHRLPPDLQLPRLLGSRTPLTCSTHSIKQEPFQSVSYDGANNLLFA